MEEKAILGPLEAKEVMDQGAWWVIRVDIEAVKKDHEGWGRGTYKGERPALLMTAFSEGESGAKCVSQGREE